MITPILAVLTSAIPVPPAMDMVPDWIHFTGGMRLRLEDTMDQNAAGDDRVRGRMRVRLGAKFDISEELKAEVRLSTNSGSTANNPYMDFGGNSQSGDTLGGATVLFDRINVTWMPADGTTLVAGKMANPLAKNPVFGEWMLDDDIQPNGVAGIWSPGGDFDMDMRLAYFVIDEVNSPGDTADPAISIFQLNFGGETDSFDWDFNNAYWNYANEGGADLGIWNSILSASMDDLTASFEYIQNLNDDTGDDTGYAVGFKYGNGGNVGDSQFFGSYMDMDQNATNFGVAQDDLPKGPAGTGVTGFIAGWKYWWMDNVTFRLWALQADNDTDDPLRLRFDLDVKLTR